MVMAVLTGTNQLRTSISLNNFPEDLRDFSKWSGTIMLTVRIPEAYFPRYEIWSPDYMLSGQEDPWFATNYLGSVLTRYALTRKRIKRLSSLQAEMLKDEEVASAWWDLVATRFDDVAFSLLGVKPGSRPLRKTVSALSRHSFQTQNKGRNVRNDIGCFMNSF